MIKPLLPEAVTALPSRAPGCVTHEILGVTRQKAKSELEGEQADPRHRTVYIRLRRTGQDAPGGIRNCRHTCASPWKCTRTDRKLAQKASLRNVGIKSCRFSPNTIQFSSLQRQIVGRKRVCKLKNTLLNQPVCQRKARTFEGRLG